MLLVIGALELIDDNSWNQSHLAWRNIEYSPVAPLVCSPVHTYKNLNISKYDPICKKERKKKDCYKNQPELWGQHQEHKSWVCLWMFQTLSGIYNQIYAYQYLSQSSFLPTKRKTFPKSVSY